MPNQCFEKVFEEVVRYVAYSDLTESFAYKSKLRTPIQYVQDSYVLLKEIHFMPKLIKKQLKSDKLSAKYRAEGNEAFRQNKDIVALEYYTKAVAFATKDGEELALAYANRSAVTFNLGEFNNSIRDIDRALQGCYPKKLMYKLLERKGKCLMELGQKKDASDAFKAALESLSKSTLNLCDVNLIKENVNALLAKNAQEEIALRVNESGLKNPTFNLPNLSHPPSEYIQVASNAVNICFSTSMGRHIVAATDINPGDVIAVEKPFASVLLPTMYKFFCFMCKKRCHSLLPCLHCTEVLFCSEKCREDSWNQSHCIECDLLPTLMSIGCENMELLAVKILLLATNAGKSIFELIANGKDLESFDDPKEKGFTDGKYLSDDYKSTHNLERNSDTRQFNDSFRRSIMAASILYALEECTDFFKYYEKKFEESPKYCHYIIELPDGGGLTIAKGIIGAHIFGYLFSVPCNAHEVAEMRLTPKEDEYGTDFVEIGGAIYPFLSLINHSCDPNVVRHNYCGDMVALTAIQFIKQGEQIFDNYSYHHAVHSKEHRQTQLLYQYFFVCKCPACIYDWPPYTSLPEKNPDYIENANKEEVEKSSVKFKKVLKEINSGKTEGQLQFLYSHLKLLHISVIRPYKEYNQCQEAIKQCLSVQGNHYINKCK